MTTSPHTYEPPPIVVGTDFTRAARPALDTARALVTATGARLLLAHVVSDRTEFGSPASGALREARRLEATARLDDHVARHGLQATDTDAVVREGEIADELTAVAAETGAELVAIGSGRGPGDRPLGTGRVLATLLGRLPCHLLIAARFARCYRRILVPLDRGTDGDPQLAAALSIAGLTSEVDVVDLSGGPGDRVTELLGRWEPLHPRLRQVAAVIPPATQMPGRGYDLVVLAAGAIGAIPVHGPPCSVMVARDVRRRARASADLEARHP